MISAKRVIVHYDPSLYLAKAAPEALVWMVLEKHVVPNVGVRWSYQEITRFGDGSVATVCETEPMQLEPFLTLIRASSASILVMQSIVWDLLRIEFTKPVVPTDDLVAEVVPRGTFAGSMC